MTKRSGITTSASRVAVIVFFLVFAVGHYLLPMGSNAARWWADLFWTAASLAATLKCFHTAQLSTGSARRAWGFIGLACLSWFIGMLIWDYQELIAEQLTPFPFWSDAGFLLFALFMGVGIFLYRGGTTGFSVTLVEISQFGIFVACVVLTHLAIFAEPLRAIEQTTLYVVTALSYPVVYMSLLIYAVATLFLHVRGTHRRALGYLVAGISAHALSDSLYAYAMLGRSYETGHYLDIAWIAGFALIFLAAGESRAAPGGRRAIAESEAEALHAARLVPFFALGATVAILFAFRDNLAPADYHRLLYPALLLAAFIGLREWASSALEARYARELRESESRLRQLFSASPAMTSITRASDGTFLDVNEGYLQATGYGREDVIGHTSLELGIWTDPADRERMLESLRSHQPARGIDVRLRTRDGSIREVLASFEPLRIGDEDCLLGIGLDITERRLAEAEMRKLSGALAQAADSVMITTPDGIIEYVNPAFEGTTGYSREEALGRTPAILNAGKQGPEFYRALWETLMRGEVFSEVFVNRRKNGELFYEQKTITPLRDGSGTITHFVATGRDISDRIKFEEQLRFLAHHDTLTELPNRALLLERLKRDLAAARSARRQLGVLFLDIDRFKFVNDTLGHDAGDCMLRELSERLQHRLRESDSIARFGGDEFVMLINEMHSAAESGALAERILQALLPPFEIKGTTLHVTASIGISLYPADGEDSGTLLKHADAAMYRAKEMGGNCFQFYSSEMGTHALKRLTLENDLRLALERNEFVLHYQPQVNIAGEFPTGVEALIRWNHPQRGLVPPDDCIPLLEETGLIAAVGRWVLDTALAQLADWHRRGWQPLSMAVNLSSRQFHEAELADRLIESLERHALPASSIELEITETTLLQYLPATAATLHKLSARGFSIALDDFGTGYSSLSYLRRFPIDTVKIDRSFVRDIPDDANDVAITRAIVVMAQSLQLRLIAEGVETTQQCEFLRGLGCNAMQGYLFSKPLDADAMSLYLEETHRSIEVSDRQA